MRSSIDNQKVLQGFLDWQHNSYSKDTATILKILLRFLLKFLQKFFRTFSSDSFRNPSEESSKNFNSYSFWDFFRNSSNYCFSDSFRSSSRDFFRSSSENSFWDFTKNKDCRESPCVFCKIYFRNSSVNLSKYYFEYSCNR